MRLSKFTVNIISFLITIGTVLYIGIWFMRTFKSDVGVEYAGISTVEQKLNADGYIIRNEEVLTLPDNGVVYYIADELEKVSKNSVVANIYASERFADTQAQIIEIDRKIKVLESSRIDKNFVITNMAKIDNQISESIIRLKNNALSRNYKITVQNGDELLTILNKRQLIAQKSDGFDDKIAQLENQRTNLSHSLTGLKSSIVTNTGGYFSTAVDGYENIFTSEQVENMTVDSFNKLITSQPDESLKTNHAGKIIKDFLWYILCSVDKSLCTEFSEGETYDIIFPHSSDTRIQFVLDKKLTQTNLPNAVLVFSTLEEPKNFDFSRLQELQIIKKSYSGLKIPKNALRIQDKFEGVFVLSGNEVKFKRIHRIFESDSFYLADLNDPLSSGEYLNNEQENNTYSYLSLYDAVITEGKELYDGKVVK
ncbi:MAG: hypothetical protein IJO74_07105 [Clostridia bacterium]|nr:hypothetical protein [Clostridia bacterium]